MEKEDLEQLKQEFSKVRKQPDDAIVIEALNQIAILSGGTIEVGDQNEVFMLQAQLNIAMGKAFDLCHSLGLEDSLAAWLMRVNSSDNKRLLDIAYAYRCKKDFGIIVDSRVAENAGEGSISAFYTLLLQPFGRFLGPLRLSEVWDNCIAVEFGAMF